MERPGWPGVSARRAAGHLDGNEHAKQLLSFFQAENKAMEETLKLYPAEFVDAIIYYNKCLSAEFNKGSEADDKQ